MTQIICVMPYEEGLRSNALPILRELGATVVSDFHGPVLSQPDNDTLVVAFHFVASSRIEPEVIRPFDSLDAAVEAGFEIPREMQHILGTTNPKILVVGRDAIGKRHIRMEFAKFLEQIHVIWDRLPKKRIRRKAPAAIVSAQA